MRYIEFVTDMSTDTLIRCHINEQNSPQPHRGVATPLDRVLHHCTVIHIKGDSYRLKERKEYMKQKPRIVNTLLEQGSN